MSFVKDLFGGGKKTQTVVSNPGQAPITYMPGHTFSGFAGTQPFSFSPSGATVGVHPSVRNTFSKYGGLTDTALGRTGQLITDLKGNANPYIAARVRPLEQSINERRGDLSRSLGQRSIYGSLANNEMLKFDTAAQRELGDQRALATNDTLNALYAAEGLDRSVRGDVLSLADGYLKTSLSELGLSLEGLNLALSGSNRRATDIAGGTSSTTTNPPSDILGGIGSIIGIAKDIKGF